MVCEAYIHTLESVDVKVSGTLEDETCSRFQDPYTYGRYFMDLSLAHGIIALLSAEWISSPSLTTTGIGLYDDAVSIRVHSQGDLGH